jgi:hypothetical protein
MQHCIPHGGGRRCKQEGCTKSVSVTLPPEIPHVPQRNFSIAVAPLHTLTSPGRRRMAQDITDTLRRAIKWAK